MSRFRYNVATMGCKANLTDSQALESRLGELGGIASSAEEADIYVLNTCTVTDQADKEARSLIRRSKARLTVAAGCLATVAPESLTNLKENGKMLVVRNSAKEEIGSAIEAWLANISSEQNSILHGDRTHWHQNLDFLPGSSLAGKSELRTRAFLKVQDGCNAFCSYCIIPHARGRSRSLSADKICEEIRQLVDRGVKEIVLTAIHAADYDSNGMDFTALIAKILAETAVQRLRLTSLDPGEIPDRLLDLMVANPRLCPHLHVSLQSANDRVLQAMKRTYTAAQIEDRLNTIKHRIPHAYIGMDIIAGFPGESAVEFEDSFARLERLPFTRMHVFPFSIRQGTAAVKLVEQGLALKPEIIKERAKRLRALSDKKMQESLQERINTIAEVLIEEKSVDYQGRQCSQGHTRSFHKVIIPGRHTSNQLRRVKLVGFANGEILRGELF